MGLFGRLLLRVKQHYHALFFFSNMRRMAEHSQYGQLLGEALLGMGDSLNGRGHYQEAVLVYKRGLMVSWRHGLPSLEFEIYRGLSKSYFGLCELPASRYFSIRDSYSIPEEEDSAARTTGLELLRGQAATQVLYTRVSDCLLSLTDIQDSFVLTASPQ
jgi:hypothetical protein